jgi:hypothetical protein
MRPIFSAGLILGALAVTGCQPPVVTDLPRSAPATIDPPTIPPDVFSTLPTAQADALAVLCDPSNDQDRVTEAFCQIPTPTPHGLNDVLTLLGLDFKDVNGGNGKNGNPGFALLGHSSALTARKISTITPTAFVFTPATGHQMPIDFVFLAFDPGEHFVEIAANAPATSTLNFYLVLFDQACTTAPGGCTPTDNLTPALTTGWSNVRVFEDGNSLGNMIVNCAVCHDPNTTGTTFLRMQEIKEPFTHWFSRSTAGGVSLLADFHAAHGTTEDYGPIPAALIDKSDPAVMARAISAAGFGEQPNVFESASIEAQVADVQPMQPSLNVPSGWSSDWQSIYDLAVAGQFIAAPYHDVKVTDPDKLAKMSGAYQSWMSGQAAEIPNIQDVFLDDGLRDMGFAPKKGLDGKGLLQQMCQECHNANLDPLITRDLFLVDQLDAMSRAEKDVAIARLNDSADTVLRMPPMLFRTITQDERAAMIAELEKKAPPFRTLNGGK